VTAEGILSELEYNLFLNIRDDILENFDEIKIISKKS
jgi:hypothetical protein